jgi:hypothetical protein
MIGYEEIGYMLPPPEKIWPPAGKGIRCETCQFYAPSEDIEDLGQCGLLSEEKQRVHVQACCNFYHNALDKKNPVLPTFPSSDKVKKALAFPEAAGKDSSKGS